MLHHSSSQSHYTSYSTGQPTRFDPFELPDQIGENIQLASSSWDLQNQAAEATLYYQSEVRYGSSYSISITFHPAANVQVLSVPAHRHGGTSVFG